MSINGKQRTAGECARQLLDALNSGSDARVRGALDRISNLSSAVTPDSRELEFRDLLAGIAEPIALAVPEFLGTGPASRSVAVRMLAHVAADAA